MYFARKQMSILLISFLFITLFYIPKEAAAAKISEGTTVGGIEIEGQSIKEARQVLEEKIETWKNGSPLIAKNDYETIEISRDLFVFDLDKTFQQLEEKMQRHWSSFFMKQKNIKQELIVEPSAEAVDMIDFPEYTDVEQTLTYATQQAKHLTAQSITLTYTEDWDGEQEQIAIIKLKIPNTHSAPTVEYAVEILDGQLIEPNNLFSFLDVVVLPSEVADSEEELSFLASGLYALALQTDLEILERHARQSPASYLETGLEATVDGEENLDLKFYHTNNYSFTIEAGLSGEEVELALTAPNADLNYSYSIENEREIAYRTIYRYNPELKPGAENVLQEGKAGKHVEVYRMNNTMEANKELISRDFYPPIHQIIEVAIKHETDEIDEASTVEDEQFETPFENEDIVKNLLDSKVRSILQNCAEDPSFCEETDQNEEIVEFLPEKDFWKLLIMLYVLETLSENENPAIIEEELRTDEEFPAEWLEPEEESEKEMEVDSSREEVQ